MKAGAAAAAALMLVAPGAGRGAAAQQAAAAGDALQPGQWEVTIRVESFEMPGKSAEAQAELRSQIDSVDSRRVCITSAQTSDPMRALLGIDRPMPRRTCRIPENVFAGGVIRLAMACQPDQESPSTPSTRLSMIGRFAATSMAARISINVDGPAERPSGPRQTARIVSSLTGRRLGDCPPDETAPAPAP